MKKILLLLTLFISACSHFESKQQRAQDLVKLYLDSTLNDPKSYQSIKFEKFDTLKSFISEDSHYISLQASFDSVMALSKSMNDQEEISEYGIDSFKQKSDNLLKQAQGFVDGQTALEKTFKPKQIGWKIFHTFRAKNGFGALTIGTQFFTFDSALTKVTSTEAVKDTIK